jgi:hypothetical protein
VVGNTAGNPRDFVGQPILGSGGNDSIETRAGVRGGSA